MGSTPMLVMLLDAEWLVMYGTQTHERVAYMLVIIPVVEVDRSLGSELTVEIPRYPSCSFVSLCIGSWRSMRYHLRWSWSVFLERFLHVVGSIITAQQIFWHSCGTPNAFS